MQRRGGQRLESNTQRGNGFRFGPRVAGHFGEGRQERDVGGFVCDRGEDVVTECPHSGR